MAGDDDKQWHLDKRVPIALIFAIIAQSFVLGPLVLAFAGRDIAAAPADVLAICSIWLAIYGLGHTAKDIATKWRDAKLAEK